MEFIMAALTIASVFGMGAWLLAGSDREGGHVQELPDGTPWSEQAAKAHVESTLAASATEGDHAASEDGNEAARGEAAALAKPGRSIDLAGDGK